MSKAADNIEAKSRSLKDLLFEKHYKVGYFQREYKWKRTHIEDLIIDLERSFNSNYDSTHSQKDVANYSKYYMGPIVLYMDNSEYSIIDGQQRLTSFVLIMIFLNHQFKSIFKIKDKFKGYIYSEHYGEEAYNMNIQDRVDILDFLFTGTEFDEKILKTESCRTILDRYNDIVELFPPDLLEKNVFPLFANWLVEKLVFIEILTQTSESAYTIFETMNDRGLNLTQTELLKSFLLSNVKDDNKIKELDLIWKSKISLLNTIEEDQDFFKAWFRSKYAETIRTTEKDSENKDFEKVGTRFSSWVQENTKVKGTCDSKLLLDMKDSSSFYFFVKSDFSFFIDQYIKLKNIEFSEIIPEQRLRLISYRGVSQSLSFPLILSPIQKTDIEEIINKKIDTVVKYIDSFGAFRMLLNESITHSSIRNAIYLKIKEIRNNDMLELEKKLKDEINQYKIKYLNESYTPININSKYILSRLFNSKFPDITFENIYFQRRRDSYVVYKFLKIEDFETEKNGLPRPLKDIILNSLCALVMVPRPLVGELDGMPFEKRLSKLVKDKLIWDFNSTSEVDYDNLKNVFIKREKSIKDQIINYWKI